MVAASAEYLSTEKVFTPLFIWNGEPPDGSIGFLKQFLAYDCRVVVRDLEPLAFVFQLHAAAANLLYLALTDHIGTDIPLILQHTQNR